jgi:hypothetical protein
MKGRYSVLKKSIPDYMLELANDLDGLETIFLNKYFEFIQMYWLLKDYSENISKLVYDEDDEEKGLKIKVKINNVKTKDVVKQLISEANTYVDADNINIWDDRKGIHIHIKEIENT